MPGQSRRFVATVLFTDVVGSTETAAEVGDRRWSAILKAYYEVARREVRRFHGREIDTAGDGFFAAFDAPNDGVRCATAIVESLWARGIPIRAGLHSGECEIVGKKVGGIAVHIGARVAGLAGAGQVLVTGTVRDLAAGSALRFDPRGARELKGVPGEWNVYEVEPGAPLPDLPPLEAPPEEPPAGRGRRRIAVAVAALAVAAAGIGIPLALLGHSDSPRAARSHGPGAGGASPTAGATRPATDRFTGAVAIDPSTGKPAGRVPVSLTSNDVLEGHDITSGFGFIWLSDFNGNAVHKLNPSTGTVVGSVPVTYPESVAVAGSDTWVASGYPGCTLCELDRIDARSNTVGDKLDVAVCCGGIVIDHGALWVLSNITLFRVDLGTQKSTTTQIGGNAITAGGGRIWVLDRALATVTPVVESTGRPERPIQLEGASPTLLTYASGALWVTDKSEGVVRRIPVTGNGGVEAVTVGAGAAGVTAGAGSVWVANSEEGTVTQIEPVGATVTRTIPVGGRPTRLTVAFGKVWVTETPPA